MTGTLPAVESLKRNSLLAPARPGDFDGMGQKRPPTKTVRVHVDVAQMVDTCSAAEGIPAPEWLSEILRPILLERLPKAVESLLKKQEPQPSQTRKPRTKSDK